MKLLLFSDLHCDAAAARELVDRARDVDVAVGAGDFATCRRGIEKTVEVLAQIDRPTIVVPGNSESVEELQQACDAWPSAYVLHGTGVSIDNVNFFGLGGAVPVTPFGSWSYDFTEEQAAELLANCPERCVLVTHSPPKGAADVSRGNNLGSTSVRNAIEQRNPLLVVCGHIHESWGKTEKVGTTPVVNAGPAGIEWELMTDR